MTSVLLIYPYFKPPRDRSVFRFPPLGVSYLAATLLEAGYTVEVLDCTFLSRSEALKRALAVKADVAGLYCMVTMLDDCRWLAGHLRRQGLFLIAGGPLPTCDPAPFLDDFDVVVRGEGEQTLRELVDAYAQRADWRSVPGIVYRAQRGAPDPEAPQLAFTPERPFTADLDRLPFPARALLPNADYIRHGQRTYGYAITTVMSSRGCPFRCEFCSNVVFGGSYRERSPQNVVDEVEEALALGYDRISFADDVFTLNPKRVIAICDEIARRRLQFSWECLGRVDSLDYATTLKMRQAGCTRIFFGIESGNDQILELMHKRITTAQARQAVEAAHQAGLQVGAFFILCYPGETDEMVLNTLRFAGSLPLDYLGLTMPYPLPGTALYDRIKGQINRDWRPGESVFGSHVLIYAAGFSEAKMGLAILKGHVQLALRKRLGRLAPLGLSLFEKPTDALFRWLR
jgi:anaerobic magnesium-protoporphyrin IX monomethyl ester cyclase